MENSNKSNFVINVDVKLNEESLDAITNQIYEKLEEKIKLGNVEDVESLAKCITSMFPSTMLEQLNK